MLPVKNKDNYKSKYQSQFLLIAPPGTYDWSKLAPGGLYRGLARIHMRDGVCVRIAYV